MPRRSVLTCSTATGLFGLYLLYAQWVTPLVAPQNSVRGPLPAPPPPTSRPQRSVAMAERYLSRYEWPADAQYQMSTGKAFVYAEEWKPVDSDQAIRFAPFAMVWQPESQGDDEVPLTVVSDFATVKFASKFSITNPNPGRVVSGALEGSVRINGPNGLVIVGRNFVFSEEAMRIWSDHPVAFTYGPHRGRADAVQIELLPAEDGRDESKLAVAGIQSIRLRRNIAMDLAFDEEKKADKDPQPVPVNVRCAGSFQFVVDTNIGTFDEDVRVYRPTGPGRYDSLQCDVLTLLFEPKPADGTRSVPATVAEAAGGRTAEPGEKTAGEAAHPEEKLALGEQSADAPEADDERPFRSLDSNLTFRRLRAEGRRVVLASEENSLTASMTEFIYDAATKVASLSDAKMVRVVQGTSQLHSPEITLVHDDRGKIASAWCSGRGWLNRHDPETGKLQFAAQWEKQLRKYTDEKTKLDVIELEQRALVRQPEEKTGLAAEFIRLWFDSQGDDAAAADAKGFRPRRLVALNDVAIVSPQMQGETKRLDVAFEEGPLLPDDPSERPRPPELAAKTNSADSATPGTLRRVAFRKPPAPAGSDSGSAAKEGSSVGKEASSAGGALSKVSKKSDNPLEVVSDAIRVLVLRDPESNESKVADIWTEGNARVTQQHEPGVEPLRLIGHRLHVRNRSERDQLLDLYGSPAHIHDRGLHIEGKEIHLDRGLNVAWVSGAGLLQLPVKRSLAGETLGAPQLLDVWWQEQMTFDGETAEFYGDVRTVLDDNRMRCHHMQVLLTKRISFVTDANDGSFSRGPLGPESAQGDVEIKTVICKDAVEFDSFEYDEENKPTSIRRARFGEFTLHQLTGETEATGPGWINFWRRGRGKRAALSPAATVQANAPLEPNAADWEYTRIDFVGKTAGNVKQQFTTFHDRVQILYGPVDRPLATLDPDDLPKDGGWMRCNTLRFTQHETAAGTPGGTSAKDKGDRFIELLAEGNAELEGRSFHARADSISYDESKGLYMLRSLGNRKATIWRQTQLGGEMSRAEAQRMEFVPARNQLKFDRTTGLDGLQ